MYYITPDRATTRIITAGPTTHTSPDEQDRFYSVLVQVEHKTNYDNSTPYEASLTVYYRLLNTEANRSEDGERHCLTAHYIRTSKDTGGDIRITGSIGGGAFLELRPPEMRGRRIGSYLMNEVVRWALHWPGAEVYVIELLKGQALTIPEKERRNRFYAQFGIEFDFDNPTTQETGTSKPMTAGGLKTVDTWKENITEHEVAPYLNSRFQELNDLRREVMFLTRDVERGREELAFAGAHIASAKASSFSLKTTVISILLALGAAMLYVKLA